MKLKEAVEKVKDYLDINIFGQCYVASEAIYHLAGGKKIGLKPGNIKHEGTSHWYLIAANGQIIDVTVSQFNKVPDYSKGRGRGFLTKKPCKRTKEIIDEILN